MGEPLLRSQFDAAVKVIQSLPKDGSFKPSHELMLKFYALYKQATLGECTAAKPSFWDVVGKAKWEAWSSLGAMSREGAMQGYVTQLKQLFETMPRTDEVGGMAKELNTFQQLISNTQTEQSLPRTDSSSEDSLVTSAGKIGATEPPLANGHIGSKGPISSQEPVSHDCNSATSKSSYHSAEQSTSEDITEHIDIKPDLVATGPRKNSSKDVNKTDEEPAGSIESDSTDSEDYMDSSDVISTSNSAKEKTVDLLASCPADLTEEVTDGLTKSAGSTSSSIRQPSSKSKPGAVHRPAVSFVLPEDGPSTERGEYSPTRSEQVNEKLRMALLNMQQEMSSLERRLGLVEQMTVNEKRRQLDRTQNLMKWWPFPELQPRTVILLMLWPVFIAWFMTYLSSRRKQR